MKGRTKKAATTVAVPQTRDEADRMLARLGELQRDMKLREMAMAESIAAIKGEVETAVQPLHQEATEILQGLEIWATANRHVLTDGGRTKTVMLPAGSLLWRQAPNSVSIKGAEAVIAYLQAEGPPDFLRTKVEIDKEAMLKAPDVARAIPGVTIASRGEQFEAQPLALTVAPAAPAAAA